MASFFHEYSTWPVFDSAIRRARAAGAIPGVALELHASSVSVTNVETERNGHAGVSREKISVRIMSDPDFSVDVSGAAKENSHTHEILECETSAGCLIVDSGP